MAHRSARLGVVALIAAAAAALASFCVVPRAQAGVSSTRKAFVLAHASGGTVTLLAAKVGKLGSVLVNKSGHVLYMYAPDGAKKVTCNISCQSFWPVLAGPAHGKAKAVGAVEQKLIGSARNPYGKGNVVTYNGWPLYTYIGDGSAHQASGQDINVNGGYWWVMHPNGKIEK